MKLYTLTAILMVAALSTTAAEKPQDPLDRIWVPAMCFINNKTTRKQLCSIDYGQAKGKRLLIVPPLEVACFHTPQKGCTLYWEKKEIPIFHPSTKGGKPQTNIILSYK